MKFSVDRDQLSDAVTWVARCLPNRPPVPVLGGILLTLDADTLVVAGFDYEVSSRADVAVDASEDGRALVSGKLLAQITSSLPSKPVHVELDGSKVVIRCGSSRFSLPTMPVEDYPEIPELPEAAGTVAAGTFADAVAQTAVAAGKDDTLPMLTGVRMEFEGDRMTMAATDRFRLAVRELGWVPARPDVSTAILVPAKTLSDTVRGIPADTQVTIALGDGLVGFHIGDRRTTVRLLDVEYVKYRSLLPTEHTTTVTLRTAELAEAIKRVALVTDRGHHLRMALADATLALSAGGDDEGSAEEALPVASDGDDIVIAFSPSYLLDGLSVLRTEQVTLAMTAPGRPALLLPVVSDDGTTSVDAEYRYLVMPARLPG